MSPNIIQIWTVSNIRIHDYSIIRLTALITAAFQAVLKSDTDGEEDPTVIDYEMPFVNEHNKYNGSTGKFTAHKAGYYVFHWTCRSNATDSFRTALEVNGNFKVHIECILSYGKFWISTLCCKQNRESTKGYSR